MPPAAVVTPNLLTDPGYLWIGPPGTVPWTLTVAGSVFTDTINAAMLPLGATEDGTEMTYTSEVEALSVAEFFDPIAYRTTGRSGNIAFGLANVGLSNYRRALNNGTAVLTPTSGTGATALYTVEPPTPGTETRAVIAWESQDSTLRLVGYQCFQGGEITLTARKAPTLGFIPCTFNFEVNGSGKTFSLYGAGATRA